MPRIPEAEIERLKREIGKGRIKRPFVYPAICCAACAAVRIGMP